MSHKKVFYCLLLLFCGSGGALFFCCYQEWLVVYWNKPYLKKENAGEHSSKTVQLFLWKQDTWYQEETSALWSKKTTSNFQTLIEHWLALQKEEGTLDASVRVETVMASPSGQEIYVSFNHSPFSKNWSTAKKHMFIEGLLKTVRDNNLTCAGIYFLVHHQPLSDYHLDFSIMWPLSGFLIQ